MRRWIILGVGLPVYAFVLMMVGTLMLRILIEEDPRDIEAASAVQDVASMIWEGEWWASVGVGALIVVGLQAAFLLPVFRTKPPQEGRPKSFKISLVIAGFVAGILTLALGTGIVSLISVVADVDSDSAEMEWVWFIPLGMFAFGWAIWTFLLFVYVRGIWADRILGRIVGVLIAGTLLEVLVVLPLDVMVRRRTDCYCGEGTFFTLCLAGIATLWLAGPGIVIALTCRKHRRWRELHCFRCGYAKGPSPGAVCPECGYAWLDAPRAAK